MGQKGAAVGREKLLFHRLRFLEPVAIAPPSASLPAIGVAVASSASFKPVVITIPARASEYTEQRIIVAAWTTSIPATVARVVAINKLATLLVRVSEHPAITPLTHCVRSDAQHHEQTQGGRSDDFCKW